MGDTGRSVAGLLGYCAANSSERHRLGHAARATYEDHFRTELSAGRIAEIMEGVI